MSQRQDSAISPAGAEREAGYFSVIDQYSVFDGTFVAERDLRIEGQVKGTINCHGTLFVARGASVSAKVEAENIAVAGDLDGEIRCRGKLQLLPSGKVRGQVTTATLVIAEGAVYDGDLTMIAAPSTPTTNPGNVRSESAEFEEPVEVESVSTAPIEVDSEPISPNTFIRRMGGPEKPWQEPDEGPGDR